MTAFANQLTSVVAGNTATTTAEFIVPTEFTQLSSGYIIYDLIDANSVSYATGTATNFSVSAISNASQVVGQCSIAVPSSIPVTVVGTLYQLRFTLVLPAEDNQEFYIYSQITVLPAVAAAPGAQDQVELVNSNVLMFLTLPVAYSNVTCSIYFNNTTIASALATAAPTSTSEGYQYSIAITPALYSMTPSLIPYNVIWQYNNGAGTQTFSESASLYIVTPSILVAIKDITTLINKARGHFGYQPVFNDVEIVAFLRSGADLFNGQYQPTGFDMTNAQGPIRYLWLQCSSVIALRSQYMMEAETVFNFSGSSVSLDVDRTSYYEGLASTLESALSEPLRALKINLTKRGLISGDGSANPLALNFNAIGTIGITATPVSNLRSTNVSSWLLGGSGPP